MTKEEAAMKPEDEGIMKRTQREEGTGELNITGKS